MEDGRKRITSIKKQSLLRVNFNDKDLQTNEYIETSNNNTIFPTYANYNSNNMTLFTENNNNDYNYNSTLKNNYLSTIGGNILNDNSYNYFSNNYSFVNPNISNNTEYNNSNYTGINDRNNKSNLDNCNKKSISSSTYIDNFYSNSNINNSNDKLSSSMRRNLNESIKLNTNNKNDDYISNSNIKDNKNDNDTKDNKDNKNILKPNTTDNINTNTNNNFLLNVNSMYNNKQHEEEYLKLESLILKKSKNKKKSFINQTSSISVINDQINSERENNKTNTNKNDVSSFSGTKESDININNKTNTNKQDCYEETKTEFLLTYSNDLDNEIKKIMIENKMLEEQVSSLETVKFNLKYTSKKETAIGNVRKITTMLNNSNSNTRKNSNIGVECVCDKEECLNVKNELELLKKTYYKMMKKSVYKDNFFKVVSNKKNTDDDIKANKE